MQTRSRIVWEVNCT